MKLEKEIAGAPEPQAGDGLDYWAAYAMHGDGSKPPRAVLSKVERRALQRAHEILEKLHDSMPDDADWWTPMGSAAAHIDDVLTEHAGAGFIRLD